MKIVWHVVLFIRSQLQVTLWNVREINDEQLHMFLIKFKWPVFLG